MRLSLSITAKLLLILLPLVCLPTAVVGYFSYEASLKRVKRLSREEQILRAKAAAARIDRIFEGCLKDLQMITRLTTAEDFLHDIKDLRKAPSGQSREQVIRLLDSLLDRSVYYHRISLVDLNGHQFISLTRKEGHNLFDSGGEIPVPELSWSVGENTFMSDVILSPRRQGYVLYFGRPALGGEEQIGAMAIIELDYEKIVELVRQIRMGEEGYGFLIDRYGRTVAHPLFRPYDYNLSKYMDPRMREFVIDMMAGEAGWKTYYYTGEKAVAYAPIPAINWSVAVAIPIEEFVKEATALGTRMIHVVIATVVVTLIVVIILSYSLLRPVKRLVSATERLAKGDLSQEIPVKTADELGALTRSFNHMVRNLREIQNELVRSEKLISLGRISAGVAHEIRNPLNAMKGAISVLRRKKSDDPLITEYAHIILEEIEHLNKFVTEFLCLAKQTSPSPVSTSFNELIQNTLILFEAKLKEKNIVLKKDLDNRLPPLQIDPRQMGQVIVNLVINAMDAMPEGGVMKVQTRYLREGNEVDGPAAIASIRDSGVGIPNQNLQTVFDPFFSTKESGTGLGLPISLSIVESHGGVLRIVSQEGGGTEAIITLPVPPGAVGGRDEQEDPRGR